MSGAEVDPHQSKSILTDLDICRLVLKQCVLFLGLFANKPATYLSLPVDKRRTLAIKVMFAVTLNSWLYHFHMQIQFEIHGLIDVGK